MSGRPVWWSEERDGCWSLYDGDQPTGGACRKCDYCACDGCFADVPAGPLRDELVRDWGICFVNPDEPTLVALDEEHESDECWVGDE